LKENTAISLAFQMGDESVKVIYIDQNTDLSAFKPEPCVMALGFFDGVHVGHRKIIETAKRLAKKKQLTLAVMTFFPHPSQVIPTSKKVNSYLSPLSIKQEIFAKLGVEKLYIVKFDEDFSKLSHREFVDRFLISLCCRHAVAGFDFTYGYKGKGTMEQLEQDGKGIFEVTTVPEVKYQNKKISSSMIRQLLLSGMVHDVPHYLGDYYSVLCTITNSEEEDKEKMTFHARLEYDYMIPKIGEYVVQIEIGRNYYRGICNISAKTLHTNMLNGTIIGLNKINDKQSIKLAFIRRLSDEETSANNKKLKSVI
jgi:riboflavin kinase / FMN adenylyltransferase